MKQARYCNRGTVELAELKPGQFVWFRPYGSKRWVKVQVERHVDIRSCNKLKTDTDSVEVDVISEKQVTTASQHFSHYKATKEQSHSSPPTEPLIWVHQT